MNENADDQSPIKSLVKLNLKKQYKDITTQLTCNLGSCNSILDEDAFMNLVIYSVNLMVKNGYKN